MRARRGFLIASYVLLTFVARRSAGQTYRGFAWHELMGSGPSVAKPTSVAGFTVHVEFRDQDVKSIEAYAFVGKMIRCQAGGSNPSYWPCMDGVRRIHPSDKETSCQSGQDGRLSCSFQFELRPNDALVEYSADAFDAKKNDPNKKMVAFTEAILFGIGPPAKDGGYSLAVPLWVHAETSTVTKRNIVFLPSPEYSLQGDDKGLVDFRLQADHFLRPVFFANGNTFAELLWSNSERVNLWTGGYGADRLNPLWPNYLCEFKIDSALNRVVAAMDGVVLVHEWDQAKECSQIELADKYVPQRLKGTVHATRGEGLVPSWVLVHEVGHFLFGQSDEYCCDGGLRPEVPFRNVYIDPVQCAMRAEYNCPRVSAAPSQAIYRRLDGIEGRREIMATRQFERGLEETEWGESSHCWGQSIFDRLAVQAPTTVEPGILLRFLVPRGENPFPNYSASDAVRYRSSSSCGGRTIGIEILDANSSHRFPESTPLRVVRRVEERIVLSRQVYAQEGGGTNSPAQDEVLVAVSEDGVVEGRVRLLIERDDRSEGELCPEENFAVEFFAAFCRAGQSQPPLCERLRQRQP